MFEILLAPIGKVDRLILEWLAIAMKDSLKLPCSVEEGLVDPEYAFHPTRGQYHSTRLLERLQLPGHRQQQRRLGIIEEDLYVPILTFVFGEAQLNNVAAVISTYRLKQEFYGLPRDEALLLERVEKEALHELGHTFGLVHCGDLECVMHFSNSIEQIDLKSNQCCLPCGEYLRQVMQQPL
jgi:archaemetzincin